METKELLWRLEMELLLSEMDQSFMENEGGWVASENFDQHNLRILELLATTKDKGNKAADEMYRIIERTCVLAEIIPSIVTNDPLQPYEFDDLVCAYRHLEQEQKDNVFKTICSSPIQLLV